MCLTSRAVSVQVLVQSMSLFAWLATGPSFSRHYQQNTVAFALKDRTRKRVNLGVSPCLGVELDGQAESQVICGLAEIDVSFAYDHSIDLSASERVQYQHWVTTMDVPASDLWFVRIVNVLQLQDKAPLGSFCRRHASICFRIIEPDASQALSDYMPDNIPAWANDLNDFALCLLIPPEFLQRICSGDWACLAFPSPWSSGVFKAPRWFQDVFAPLRPEFEREQNQDALRDNGIFNLNSCNALLSDLRGILAGQQDPTATLPWITRLQRFDDSVFKAKHSGLKLDMRRVVEFVLLSEVLKNSDRLKVSMIAACKALLPAQIFDSLQDSFVCQRVPGKSEISRFRLSVDCAMMLWHRVTNYKEYCSRASHARYLVWDSSPQFRKASLCAHVS